MKEHPIFAQIRARFEAANPQDQLLTAAILSGCVELEKTGSLDSEAVVVQAAMNSLRGAIERELDAIRRLP